MFSFRSCSEFSNKYNKVTIQYAFFIRYRMCNDSILLLARESFFFTGDFTIRTYPYKQAQ